MWLSPKALSRLLAMKELPTNLRTQFGKVQVPHSVLSTHPEQPSVVLGCRALAPRKNQAVVCCSAIGAGGAKGSTSKTATPMTQQEKRSLKSNSLQYFRLFTSVKLGTASKHQMLQANRLQCRGLCGKLSMLPLQPGHSACISHAQNQCHLTLPTSPRNKLWIPGRGKLCALAWQNFRTRREGICRRLPPLPTLPACGTKRAVPWEALGHPSSRRALL